MDNDKQHFNVDETQGFKMHESLDDAFDVGILRYEWEIAMSIPCLMDQVYVMLHQSC